MVSSVILLIIILLIMINGFLITAEFSLLRVPKTFIDECISNNSWGSKKLALIVGNLNHYITSLQIGITITTLALGVIAVPFFTEIFKAMARLIDINLSNSQIRLIALILGFITIVSIHTIFGQIGPKIVTIQLIERMAVLTAVPTYWLTKIISPFSRFITKSTIFLLQIIRIPTVQEVYRQVYSEDELKLIIAQSKEEGEIDATEQMMINRIFDFTDTTVKEIITPRYKIVAFSIDSNIDDVMEKARSTGFSRFPVYEENLDQIIGFVHIKDVILSHHDSKFSLRNILRKVIVIHEGMRLDTLLKKMQIKRSQVAIAIDEYGSVEGLVTIEDLLEEIVGEIDDEFDEEPSSMIIKRKDKSYIIDARITLDHFNRALNTSLEAVDSVTLAGFILEHLDALTEEGSSFEYNKCKFTVEKIDGNRIAKVHVVKLEKDDEVNDKYFDPIPYENKPQHKNDN